jgi:hypothetical protein
MDGRSEPLALERVNARAVLLRALTAPAEPPAETPVRFLVRQLTLPEVLDNFLTSPHLTPQRSPPQVALTAVGLLASGLQLLSMVSARERVFEKHDDDVVIVSAVRTALTKVRKHSFSFKSQEPRLLSSSSQVSAYKSH